MKIKAKFIGEDGSLGYKYGKIYKLNINGFYSTTTIRILRDDNQGVCEYSSFEKFLENWTNVAKR